MHCLLSTCCPFDQYSDIYLCLSQFFSQVSDLAHGPLGFFVGIIIMKSFFLLLLFLSIMSGLFKCLFAPPPPHPGNFSNECFQPLFIDKTFVLKVADIHFLNRVLSAHVQLVYAVMLAIISIRIRFPLYLAQ